MENHQKEKRRNLKADERTPHSLGRSGEEAALDYLKKKKYRIIQRGFRLLRGEIDIIAYDRGTLVFIEVKTRKSKDYGPPEESVTPSKQKQIRRIAEAFLVRNHFQDVECRFDVLSLFLTEKGDYQIQHILNAF